MSNVVSIYGKNLQLYFDGEQILSLLHTMLDAACQIDDLIERKVITAECLDWESLFLEASSIVDPRLSIHGDAKKYTERQRECSDKYMNLCSAYRDAPDVDKTPLILDYLYELCLDYERRLK